VDNRLLRCAWSRWKVDVKETGILAGREIVSERCKESDLEGATCWVGIATLQSSPWTDEFFKQVGPPFHQSWKVSSLEAEMSFQKS
jgi:hypothetical protein